MTSPLITRFAVLLCATVLAGCASIPEDGVPPPPEELPEESEGEAPQVTTGAPEVAEPDEADAPTDDTDPANTADRERDQGEEDANAGDGPDRDAEARAAARAQRPGWLGSRPLPLRDDGLGEIQPTPPELVDRRLAPPEEVAPPPPDDAFTAHAEPVPDDVLARSTWHDGCPVTADELTYLRLAFWGFDDRPHTGEMLVHSDVADDVIAVFEALFEARFPIEEMRITRAEELDWHPTGDGNNTGSFVCRASVGSGSWSDHASGLAVDINPFHNPYQRGDIVIPELASAYTDRDEHRPGMIQPGDVVTEAFADIGWGWGGDWSSAKDWMHFSQSGR